MKLNNLYDLYKLLINKFKRKYVNEFISSVPLYENCAVRFVIFMIHFNSNLMKKVFFSALTYMYIRCFIIL